MASQPSSAVAGETTVGRVSAATMIIPIKQELTAPLTFAMVDGLPALTYGDGPWVRPVENLLMVFEAVRVLAAARQPMGLNEVATIHFARWVIIDEGRRLLFCANYDTSLDQYLTDFMLIANTRQAPYMDALWGTLVDYPGAEPTASINWGRRWEVDTTLFFPTISDVTLKDIAWLRQFRHLYTEFDRFAQEVPADQWPPALLAKYNELKTRANAIDLSVVM